MHDIRSIYEVNITASIDLTAATFPVALFKKLNISLSYSRYNFPMHQAFQAILLLIYRAMIEVYSSAIKSSERFLPLFFARYKAVSASFKIE